MATANDLYLPLVPVGTAVEYYRTDTEGFSGVGTVVGHGTRTDIDYRGDTGGEVIPVMLVQSTNYDETVVRVAWAVKEIQ
jgi:hypothetical protein